MKLLERLREVAIEQGGIEEEDFVPTMKLMGEEGLGFDSLDLVEFVMGVESEFNISVPDQDAEKFITVQDVIDYVEKAVAK